MSSAPSAPGLGVLLGTLVSAQTFGTVSTMVLPAVAPEVASTYGIDASLIGYQISVVAAFMLVSLTLGSGLSVRWGACRTTQAALALCATGCLAAVLPHADTSDKQSNPTMSGKKKSLPASTFACLKRPYRFY